MKPVSLFSPPCTSLVRLQEMPAPWWTTWSSLVPTSQLPPRSHSIVQTYRCTHCTSAEMTLQRASALLSLWGGSCVCLPALCAVLLPASSRAGAVWGLRSHKGVWLLHPRQPWWTIKATSCLPWQLQVWFSACHAIWGLPKQCSKGYNAASKNSLERNIFTGKS